jgi:hypothetical protein
MTEWMGCSSKEMALEKEKRDLVFYFFLLTSIEVNGKVLVFKPRVGNL